MPLHVFPYILSRYAAMDIARLREWTCHGITDIIAADDTLSLALTQQREQCCDLLYELISREVEPTRQKRLLNIKRDLFNQRPLKKEQLETLADLPHLLSMLDTLGSLTEQLRQQRTLWEQQHQQQLQHHRQLLQQWAQEPLLRNGLLLSSSSLNEQLDDFSVRSPVQFGHRELKNEYSILRYLTRMACKTSPFSTFTYTGLSTLTEAPALLTTPVINSHVRLNNFLYRQLHQLMTIHPVLNETLSLRLNSTTVLRDGKLGFLLNYNNVESFQQMTAGGLNGLVYQMLTAADEAPTLGHLTDQLLEAVDAERDAIKTALLQLTVIGLLETETGCSGLAPDWDRQLLVFLENKGNVCPPLTSLLQSLQSYKTGYVQAGHRERSRLLGTMHHQLYHVIQELETAAGVTSRSPEQIQEMIAAQQEAYLAGKGFRALPYLPVRFKAEQLLYEDAATTTTAALPANDIQAITSACQRLAVLLETADTMAAERTAMKDFFIQHYSPDDQVPVTDFYRDWYRVHKKTARATGQKKSPMPLEVYMPSMEMKMEKYRISVTVSPVLSPPTAARAAFIQLYRQDEGVGYKAVVNALLPGMGKLSGRFLHLFPSDVTALHREWNTRMGPGIHMLELNDASGFNANIHPPLLDYEAAMPGGNNNLPTAARIPVNRLTVRCSDDKLQLMDGDQEVWAFDLCLESFYNRSDFYQLLAHFNPLPGISLKSFIAALDAEHVARFPTPDNGIRYLPRIVTDELLVIRRQAWLVPVSALPAQEKNITEAAFFTTLCKWLQVHHIPPEVFLYLRMPGTPATGDKQQRDDYKPQFIHFHQPLLTGLFRKLLQKAGTHLYMEEVLPAPDHWQTGQPVTEHLLQWYHYA